MEPREIAEYMACAIRSRKQILNLVFGRKKDKREKKIESWVQAEMLAKLIELEESKKDGTPDYVKSEHGYPYQKLLFSIPHADQILNELDNITQEVQLPELLQTELKNKSEELGANLTNNPTISLVKDKEWQIKGLSGDRKTCVVIKEEGKLDFRSRNKESCDFWWKIDGEEHWLELKSQIRTQSKKKDVDQHEIASDLKKKENLKSTDVFHQFVLVFLKPSDTEEIKKEYTDIYLCAGILCEELWRRCLGDNRQILVLFCSEFP